MTLTTGTFKRIERVTEHTNRGEDLEYTATSVIIIEEKNFNGMARMYQTEREYRNNVMISSAQYPADTDFAKRRRIFVMGDQA